VRVDFFEQLDKPLVERGTEGVVGAQQREEEYKKAKKAAGLSQQ
jgi:hypothetical protein